MSWFLLLSNWLFSYLKNCCTFDSAKHSVLQPIIGWELQNSRFLFFLFFFFFSFFYLVLSAPEGGDRKWNLLFTSIFTPKCQGGREIIFWIGSWLRMVFLKWVPFIILYWTPLLFLSLRRAFGVYKYLKGCLSFYGQQLRVGFSQLITCYEGLAPC